MFGLTGEMRLVQSNRIPLDLVLRTALIAELFAPYVVEVKKEMVLKVIIVTTP